MFKVIFCLLCLICSTISFGGNSGLKISKKQITGSLQMLHSMGKLSDHDYEKAVKELQGYSNEQLNDLVKKGLLMSKGSLKLKGQ